MIRSDLLINAMNASQLLHVNNTMVCCLDLAADLVLSVGILLQNYEVDEQLNRHDSPVPYLHMTHP